MRVCIAALLAFFLALGVAPAARADDAQALLAKHKAFVGWQFGDGTFTAFDMQREGTSATGRVTEMAVEHRVALVYRRDYGKGDSSGFTGKIFWGTNRNGFTVPYIGDEAQRLLSTDVLLMEGTAELPAQMHGTTTVDGKSVPVVRVTMKGAKPMDLAIDPDTGAYVKVTIDPEGASETMTISSYQTIAPGKKMIGSWSDANGSYRYTKVVVNPPLRDENFRPPAPLATWTFGTGTVPITVNDDGIFFMAKVNGVQGTFALDTGTDGILLTDEFANRAGLKTVGKSSAQAIGGEIKTLSRHADSIAFGNGDVLSNVLVYTENSDHREGKFNQKIDGFFGSDFLAGARVNLNLGAQTMSIGPADEAATAPSGGYVVAVDLSNGTPTIPLQLDGKLTVDAAMDTGSSAGTLISAKVRDHGIIMVSAASDLSSGAGEIANHGFLGGNRTIEGVGGETENVYCGSLDKVAVGPLIYQNNLICESQHRALNDALLGYDFLKNFDYIFDYHHGTIVMTPHHDGN